MIDVLGTVQRVRRLAAESGGVNPEGAWPLTVVIGHLAIVDRDVWLPRLRQVAEEHRPAWSWWEPQGTSWEAMYANRHVGVVAAEFDAGRRAIERHLRALDSAGWRRFGVHQTFGALDVTGLMRRMLDHDDEHLGPIEAAGASRQPG